MPSPGVVSEPHPVIHPPGSPGRHDFSHGAQTLSPLTCKFLWVLKILHRLAKILGAEMSRVTFFVFRKFQ
jgi:hypothetical protein